MIDAKQPLIYFANNSDFVNEYDNTAANEDRNKQAVFVGDNHMIYTHGVAFNGNDTIYSDTELRGLIGNLQDQDTLINGQISTLEGLVAGVQSDLQGLHDWSQEDIDDRIKALLQDAQWLQEHFPVDEIFSQSNFGEDDVKEYLQLVGLINVDENTGEVTTTWSTFQQSYNSLESRVDYLEQNGPDIEGLENRLHQYIEEDTAIADLTSKWFWSHDDDIEWALAGLKTAANNAQSFASVWSAMSQKVNGIDDTVNGTAGLVTKVDSLEDNMVAKTELATLVTQAGFATTAGTVSTSDLDGSVAALFSNTSSATNSAVNNKLAGVITETNLDNAVVTMLAKTGNDATGKLAVINAVANEIGSGITISADKITLDGDTWANTIFADWITADGVSANRLHTSYNQANYGYITDIYDNTISLDWWVTKNGTNREDTLTICGGTFDKEGGIYFNDELKIGHDGIYGPFIGNLTGDVTGNINGGTITIADDDHTYFALEEDHIISDTGLTLEGGDGDTAALTILSGGLDLASGDIKNVADIYADKINMKSDNLSCRHRPSMSIYGKNNNSDQATTMIMSTGIAGYATCTEDSSGYVTSPAASLKIRINSQTGEVTCQSLTQTSDRTLKDIVSDTSLTVEQVAEAPAVNFTWKEDSNKENKKQSVGTIAQYWQVVLPEVVGETEDGKLTMQYSNAAMISSIVTAKEVVALKEEIAELKRQIAELKAN